MVKKLKVKMKNEMKKQKPIEKKELNKKKIQNFEP
jgi:hypothetical protein